MAMLEVERIDTYYGDIQALEGISLAVDKGGIVTMIGANGAGKTTTLKTISGILASRKGRILLGGEEIQGLPAHQVVARASLLSPMDTRFSLRSPCWRT